MELTKELWNENYSLLYNVARNFLKDDILAQDVVQDVFLSYHKHEAKGVAHPRYILLYFVKHRCIDEYRHNKRVKIVDIDRVSNVTIEEVSNKYDNSLIKAIIQEEIEKLHKTQKEIFTLHYTLNLSYAEVSAYTNKNIHTVRMNYVKACNNIKKSIAKRLFNKTTTTNKQEKGGRPCRLVMDTTTGQFVEKGIKGAAAIIGMDCTSLAQQLKSNNHPRFKLIK